MPSTVAEALPATAGSMEASSPRAIFVDPPGDTAPVEAPRILKDATRIALKKKLRESKERIQRQTAQRAQTSDKSSITILSEAEANTARTAIKKRLAVASDAANQRLQKAQKLLQDKKVRLPSPEAVVDIPSDSDVSSCTDGTRSPSRSSSRSSRPPS